MKQCEHFADTRHDLAAERAILAAVLLDAGESAALQRVASIVHPDDFHEPACRTVFAAMQAVGARREPIDIVTLAAELRAMNRLNSIGGAQYLGDLTDTIPTVAHCEAHARLVADHGRARRIHVAALRVASAAADPTVSADDVSARVRAVSDAAADSHEADVELIGHGIDEEEERIHRVGADPSVRPTQIRELDEKLGGGPREGELILIGGRTSAGKTALAAQLALSYATQGETVLFYSLEMPRDQVIQRLAVQLSGVGLAEVRARRLDAEAMRRYRAALRQVRDLPILLCVSPDVRPSQIRARGLATASRFGRLGAIFVDYIQRLKPDVSRAHAHQEVGASTWALKGTAKECRCPVFGLAQLNRGAEDRTDDDPPRLRDLREAGEDDADVVAALQRLRGNPSARRLHLLKQRNGPVDEVDLVWLPETASFGDANEYSVGGYKRQADIAKVYDLDDQRRRAAGDAE